MRVSSSCRGRDVPMYAADAWRSVHGQTGRIRIFLDLRWTFGAHPDTYGVTATLCALKENTVDPRLDDLIAASAPAVTPRTDALRRDLVAVVADSEAAAASMPRWRARRAGVAGVLALATAGLGTAASATGLLPWFEDTTAVHQQHTGASGDDCEWTFAARGFEDEAHPVRPAQRAATMSAAQRFLADFNLSSISVPQAVAEYRAAQDGLAVSSGEHAPDDDLKHVEFAAVTAALNDRLSAELTRQGLSPYAVSVAGASDCAGREDKR
jgi:hypothetical protein